MENSAEYLQWKRSRTRTTVLANILILVYGIESQSLEVTLLYYFSENFGISLLKATFYYSVNETLFAVSNLISGMLFGRYIDRTRNLRFVFLLNLIVIVMGNLMYSIPWHIWFVLFGRFLCGINESLQTAVCGEFRRCYKDKELVNVLSWYEFLYAVGINTGPGLPILFSYVNIHIGWLKINKYNVIQFLTALLTFCLFLVSWSLVIDLSKDLEKLGKDAVSAARGSGKDDDYRKEQLLKEEEDEPQERKLMEWKELFQLDILSLCFSYGAMRYAVTTAVGMVTLYSINVFHWEMNTLSWLHVIVGFATYTLMMVLVYLRFFDGTLAIFYGYVVALILASCLLSLLLLPKAIVITSLAGQVAFGASIMATKCFVYFEANSAGKVLLFKTVTDSNANLIDGFRSVVGNAFRILAKSTFYYFFLYPEYFSPPVVVLGLTLAFILLYRRDLHLRR